MEAKRKVKIPRDIELTRAGAEFGLALADVIDDYHLTLLEILQIIHEQTGRLIGHSRKKRRTS